jgi:hypothetical protein
MGAGSCASHALRTHLSSQMRFHHDTQCLRSPPCLPPRTIHPETVLTARLMQSTFYVVVVDGFSTNSGVYSLTMTCPTHPSAPLINGTINCAMATTGVTTGGPSNTGNAAPDAWFAIVHRLAASCSLSFAWPLATCHHTVVTTDPWSSAWPMFGYYLAAAYP